MLSEIANNIMPAAPQATKAAALNAPAPLDATTTTAATTALAQPKVQQAKRTTTQSSRVRVAVRVRPLLAREHGEHESTAANPTGARIRVNKSHDFTFDHAYPQSSTQEHIYSTSVSPLIKEVVAGYNVTIMAYGQTGSGKTFTMGTTGHDDDDGNVDDDDDDENENENENDENASGRTSTSRSKNLSLSKDGLHVGITPRSIAELYHRLQSSGNTFEVSCSVLELYKDELRDLQRGGEEFCARGQQLRIQEVNGSIVVKNLVEIACRCPEDVREMFLLLYCSRHVFLWVLMFCFSFLGREKKRGGHVCVCMFLFDDDFSCICTHQFLFSLFSFHPHNC